MSADCGFEWTSPPSEKECGNAIKSENHFAGLYIKEDIVAIGFRLYPKSADERMLIYIPSKAVPDLVYSNMDILYMCKDNHHYLIMNREAYSTLVIRMIKQGYKKRNDLKKRVLMANEMIK